MKKNFAIYLLIIGFVFIQIVENASKIPVGVVFNEHDQEVYNRISSLAREYILNKLQKNLEYDIVEHVEIVNSKNSTKDTRSLLCNQLSNGIISIIGQISRTDYQWLSSFCSTYRVPFIGLDNHYYINTNYSISLMPDILPALISLIQHYQINQLVYSYDDRNGGNRLKQLIKMQTKNRIQNLNIICFYLGNPYNSNDLLEAIEITTSSSSSQQVHRRYIVLDFHEVDTYRIVMDKIKYHGMTTANYHYILLTLDAKSVYTNFFPNGGLHGTFFSLPSYESLNNNNNQALLLLYQNYINSIKDVHLRNVPFIESLVIADAWETLLRTINLTLNSINETHQQRYLTTNIDCRGNGTKSWSFGKFHFKTLLNINFQGLTGNVQFSRKTGQRKNYMFDIYRATRNDRPKNIGFFRAPTTLEIVDKSPYDFLMALDNRTRLVVTIFEEPFMMLKRKNGSNTVNETSIPRGTIIDPSLVEGYCADLAHVICHDKLKLPYKFLIETKYGSEIKKGVWNGIVGTLVNRDADLSIASLTISGAREKIVDFSKPFMDFGISIMIRKPVKQKSGAFSFIPPRSIEIGIFAIVSYLVFRIFSFLISRSSSYLCRFDSKLVGVGRNKLSIQDAFILSLSVFMHKNVHLLPISVSGRMTKTAWCCFNVIIVLLCTINFVAFSRFKSTVTAIQTIDDLAKQTEIRYGTIRNSSTMAFFNKSTSTTFKKMWNFMEQHKDDVFVASNHEGIEKVRLSNGKYAFLTESTFNEYANARLPCDTMRIGENLNTKSYGIATPLGSDLRAAISTAVSELKESGFLESLKQKWYYERSECTKYSQRTATINVVNVASMFYILIMSFGIAMVITILEFLLKVKIRSRRFKQQPDTSISNIRDNETT
ncbi:unnamed protein product [Rotaria magnacalcarata]|uniref:Uncharacterized protein n=1 Tax=Rotaria magnacalcarata TaxID=392030 RepID=A0A816CQ56_9BILA|nr:unnamed protein product [Rotaria magnacalcarata]CAF1625538.1 unnamed protein product [Rotaria magnacalcarata]